MENALHPAARRCDRCPELSPEVRYGWLEIRSSLRMLRLCPPCWVTAKDWRRAEDRKEASRVRQERAAASAEAKKKTARETEMAKPLARFGGPRAR